MQITTAQSEFRSRINEIYREEMQDSVGFFMSLVQNSTKTTSAKTFGIESQRGYKKAATPIVRGSSPDRIQFTKSTQRFYEPPYHALQCDFTQMDGYDRVFGMSGGEVHASVLDNFTSAASSQVREMVSIIKNAYEIQGASVLLNGTVTMADSTLLSFDRQAGSMPDVGSGDATKYWNGANADIPLDLENAAEYIRNVGKSNATEFNVYMDQTTWKSFRTKVATDTVLAKYLDTRHSTLIEIKNSVVANNGSVAKAMFGLDSYTFNIFVLTGSYDGKIGGADTNTKFWPNGYAVVLPSDIRLTMNYAGVPVKYKIRGGSNTSGIQAGIFYQEGDIIIDDYVDDINSTHNLRVRSAGLYTLVSTDRLVTIKTLA